MRLSCIHYPFIYFYFLYERDPDHDVMQYGKQTKYIIKVPRDQIKATTKTIL